MNFIIVATIKLINFAASIRDYIFYILQKILYEAYSSQKLHFDNLPNIVIKNTDKSIILIRLTNLTSMSLLYNAFSLFAWYSTNLFFSDIILINKEHVPSQGPTIVYGNHNNQFVDGILLIETIQRHVRFVAAAVSMRRAFVGSFIKATGAIPVQRPQDLEKQKGQGHITDLKVNILKGHQTKFTKLTTGSTLFIKGFPQLKIKNVRSDTQVQLQGDNPQIRGQNLPFTFLLKLDYHQLYEQVWKSLKNNECIGIFPEGGSHDRLTVLPLKAGIGIMALGAMEKYGISVKLVPCGFHYYNRQKFRSQAVLQFGPAYQIPLELVELYRTDKKKAISTLLQTLEKMLKSVTMQFDSQQQLFGLYTARQLYQISCQRQITPKQKMDLNRRFAKAYMLLRHNQKYKEQYEKLLSFSNKLQLRGIKLRREDYYGSKFIDFFKTVFYLVKCLLRSIVALPGIVMFGPTTKLIGYLAEKQRNKYLKGSMRKMQGTDVIGSYKIILSSFMLPLTGIIHSILLYFGLKKYTKLDHNTIVKASIGLFALLPVYSFLFVRSYDSFKRSVDRLKLLFMSLFKKNAYKEFNKEKKQLQKKVLAIVEEEGQKVVQNFQKNRILKREELNVAQSKLYIFDKDENQYEFKE